MTTAHVYIDRDRTITIFLESTENKAQEHLKTIRQNVHAKYKTLPDTASVGPMTDNPSVTGTTTMFRFPDGERTSTDTLRACWQFVLKELVALGYQPVTEDFLGIEGSTG